MFFTFIVLYINQHHTRHEMACQLHHNDFKSRLGATPNRKLDTPKIYNNNRISCPGATPNKIVTMSKGHIYIITISSLILLLKLKCLSCLGGHIYIIMISSLV